MHKHWFTFDISEISCKILICINDLFLYICLLVLELNGSHQHSPWSICDIWCHKWDVDDCLDSRTGLVSYFSIRCGLI